MYVAPNPPDATVTLWECPVVNVIGLITWAKATYGVLFMPWVISTFPSAVVVAAALDPIAMAFVLM
jgi:hypothetical protein